MSDYERHLGLAKRAHPDFLQNLPTEALTQLQLFREHDGYIAGGYARAVYISAITGASRQQLSDQFTDLDVYFDRELDKRCLLGLGWTDCSQAYVDAGIAVPLTSGAYIKTFASSDSRKASPALVAIFDQPCHVSSENFGVSINAITFKRGSAFSVLDSFDIDNCAVAVDGDDIIAPKDWLKIELEPCLRLRQTEIASRLSENQNSAVKHFARIGKYFSRLQRLHSQAPKLSDTDLDFLKDILMSNRAKMNTVPSSIIDMMLASYSFSDIVSIAMMLSPAYFMRSNLVQKILSV